MAWPYKTKLKKINPMTTQEANLKIIAAITDMAESNPEFRFHQILQLLDINLPGDLREHGKEGLTRYCKDLFYEDSATTLSRVLKSDRR